MCRTKVVVMYLYSTGSVQYITCKVQSFCTVQDVQQM